MSNFDNISGAMDSGSLLSIRLEIGRREVIPTTELPDFKKLLH